jgi:prepilin-type processing-associated H-X9-DG protein
MFGSVKPSDREPSTKVNRTVLVVLIKYGIVDCQLNYARHRKFGERGQRVGKALGALHLAFADGHVRQYRPEELVDRATGKSRYVALWSPIDPQCE